WTATIHSSIRTRSRLADGDPTNLVPESRGRGRWAGAHSMAKPLLCGASVGRSVFGTHFLRTEHGLKQKRQWEPLPPGAIKRQRAQDIGCMARLTLARPK